MKLHAGCRACAGQHRAHTCRKKRKVSDAWADERDKVRTGNMRKLQWHKCLSQPQKSSKVESDGFDIEAFLAQPAPTPRQCLDCNKVIESVESWKVRCHQCWKSHDKCDSSLDAMVMA